MKFTTDKPRVCCGGYVFRSGRVTEVLASDSAAVESHPDVKRVAEKPAPAPAPTEKPKKKAKRKADRY